MTWSVSDYSTTPSSNTNVNGVNVGEGCNASNINDAIRQIMADIASMVTGFVSTVAGRSGAVVLTTADITDLRIGTMKIFIGGSDPGGSANDGDLWVG